MINFRLYSADIEIQGHKSKAIKLIGRDHVISNNYFSLIIGNNGSGKSRFLSSICKSFVRQIKEVDKVNGINYSCMPERMIAITNSISDKFPSDDSFKNYYTGSYNEKYSGMDYVYLGNRNKVNTFSSKSLMVKAIDILFDNYAKKNVALNYRHLFEYLDYEPVIKLEFKIVNLFKMDLFPNGSITPKGLMFYLEKKISKGGAGFRAKKIEEIMYTEGSALEEVCEFYNSLKDQKTSNFSLTVNFSENNITKLQDDDSVYKDKYKLYELLKIMKSIGLTRSVNYKVYKKGGFEFNFGDASSGESYILSTLIALIPLVKDNSLILIDEPEISLHPSWQNQYIYLINKLLSHVTGCHIIIGTHSHFLVSDLPLNSSSVIAFRFNDNEFVAETIEAQTYGWSAEEVLLNIFKLASSRNYYVSQLVTEALEIHSTSKKDLVRLKVIKSQLSEIIDSISVNDPLNKILHLIVDR